MKSKKTTAGVRLGFICVALICSRFSYGQEEQMAKISEKDLTITQIEVYRAFLTRYMDGSDKSINVAEKTKPMEPSREDFEGCMNPFPKKTSAKDVHLFTNEFAQDDRIHLVEADKYEIPNVGSFMHRKEDLQMRFRRPSKQDY